VRGGGPAPHRHDVDEPFTGLEGTTAVTARGETVVAGAGETVNVPADAPHAFRNPGDGPARRLCPCTPAGRELAGRTPRALDADGRAAPTRSTRCAASPARLRTVRPRATAIPARTRPSRYIDSAGYQADARVRARPTANWLAFAVRGSGDV
jgi:hypothetical protein